MVTKGELKYTIGEAEYTFGTQTGYGETFSKSASTVPIVSLSYKDTFAVESSSQIVCNMKFIRVQPDSPDDTSMNCDDWSNMFWFDKMTQLVDRWQAKTDGGILSFEPEEDNPYIPPFVYNGYIKSLSKQYVEGRNLEIICNLEFHVGSMFVGPNQILKIPPTASIQPVSRDRFSIIMSDSKVSSWYPLLGRVNVVNNNEGFDINCVTRYRLYGGLEEPFEHLTMTIPKDRLNSIAPGLANSANLVPGRNKIILDAIGRSSMYLARASSEGDNFIIEGYCEATILRNKALPITHSDIPFRWIERILCEGKYGVAFHKGTENNRGSFIYSFYPREDEQDIITFKAGTNIWLILQVCAMYLGCRIFFSNGNAYLIDYRRHNSGTRIESINPAPIVNTDLELELHTSDDTNPIFGRVIDSPVFGNEGLDTLVNVQSIRCQGYNEDGVFGTINHIGRNQESINEFGEYEGDVMTVPGIVQGTGKNGESYNQGEVFVSAYLDYRAEPQQSINFTLKETQNNNGTIEWSPFFEPTVAVNSISSEILKTSITNVSGFTSKGVETRVPQKLVLSQFERRYPEGTTKYYFGQMSTIDLSSNISQVANSLNNL